ncbi:linker for activation of T-cells family member 1-like [Megalops cyprinoides]|uniref:linker for activation of T-cells family member 1-like n=1 Tax=Megalops cyprinoides TaxID=118141 RepID=UPI001863BF85|nr:linker for activation of T-cells family member 1-like [Megalops cyprinoides]
METTVLDSMLVVALLVVPVVVLAGLCMSCRKPPHTSIQQKYEDYDETRPDPVALGGFRIVRTTGPAVPVSTIHMNTSGGSGYSSHLLSASSPIQPQSRPSSFSPTEDGSIPSYENQEPPQGVDDKEDDDITGYIQVLPDPPVIVSICRSQQSLPSMQSSGAGDYVNVDSASEKSYINVKDEFTHGLLPGSSRESMDSEEDNGSSDYVNAPPRRGSLVHLPLFV